MDKAEIVKPRALESKKRRWEQVVRSGEWVSPPKIEGLLMMAERSLALALEKDQGTDPEVKAATSEFVREFSEDVEALKILASQYPNRGQLWALRTL